MGSIPRRAERRFRASQATHPPHQESLPAIMANAVFLLQIVGSIPRRAGRRFRASQATHPPHQGLLSAIMANAMFLSADRGLDSSAFPLRGGLELILLP
jgi:hypothetical protein